MILKVFYYLTVALSKRIKSFTDSELYVDFFSRKFDKRENCSFHFGK